MAVTRSNARSNAMVGEGFTSREAARISGVPFFTVDYWDRSKFLKPSIAQSAGRGRGRGRLYSYADTLRLRIARELREQHVSLQTLRHVVKRLGEIPAGLERARYVFVSEKVELVEDFAALTEVLRTKARTFGFLLDLSEIQQGVATRAAKLRSPRAPAGSRLARD
jgi:DNA-binding transcriptional MerR regulator